MFMLMFMLKVAKVARLKVARSAKGWPTCSCLKWRGKLKVGLHVHA